MTTSTRNCKDGNIRRFMIFPGNKAEIGTQPLRPQRGGPDTVTDQRWDMREEDKRQFVDSAEISLWCQPRICSGWWKLLGLENRVVWSHAKTTALPVKNNGGVDCDVANGGTMESTTLSIIPMAPNLGLAPWFWLWQDRSGFHHQIKGATKQGPMGSKVWVSDDWHHCAFDEVWFGVGLTNREAKSVVPMGSVLPPFELQECTECPFIWKRGLIIRKLIIYCATLIIKEIKM